MALRVFVNLPKDVFTKVATGATQGQIHLVKNSPNNIVSAYIQPTGDPKPADDVALGVSSFDTPETASHEPINYTVATDVYLMPIGEASRVAVDIG